VTHPRASSRPLDARTAWREVARWLETPVAWIPSPGPDYQRILGELITNHDIRGNLVPDAALAALAIENGVPVLSADTDFARFKGLHWHNPLE
jgi:predicted nucleic acid-binding protein